MNSLEVCFVVCSCDCVFVVCLVGLEYVVLDDVLVTNGLLLLPSHISLLY